MATLTLGHVTRATQTFQWLPTLGYRGIEKYFGNYFWGDATIFRPAWRT